MIAEINYSKYADEFCFSFPVRFSFNSVETDERNEYVVFRFDCCFVTYYIPVEIIDSIIIIP